MSCAFCDGLGVLDYMFTFSCVCRICSGSGKMDYEKGLARSRSLSAASRRNAAKKAVSGGQIHDVDGTPIALQPARKTAEKDQRKV